MKTFQSVIKSGQTKTEDVVDQVSGLCGPFKQLLDTVLTIY